jgi:hypothetical protein
MIAKDWCSYSIRILRHEFILRDHELLGMPGYAIKSRNFLIFGSGGWRGVKRTRRDQPAQAA